MNAIVGFGKLVLRLTPPAYERPMQTPVFHAVFEGGKTDVCVFCAHFGVSARRVSTFPKNAIGEKAEELLLSQKMDTSAIAWTGWRLGAYFIERGSNQRSSTVLYDRESSSISEAKPTDFDRNKVFVNANLLHVSGITSALSQSAAELTIFAMKETRKRGLQVSCGLNYHKKSSEIIPEIVKNTDCPTANEEDIQPCFGICSDTEAGKGHLAVFGYEAPVKKVKGIHPNLMGIATTSRESIRANHNWRVAHFFQNELYVSKKYQITDIVGRIGRGASFADAVRGRGFLCTF